MAAIEVEEIDRGVLAVAVGEHNGRLHVVEDVSVIVPAAAPAVMVEASIFDTVVGKEVT